MCSKKIDKDNYKKDRTICKNCYNRKTRNNDNIIVPEKPNNNNAGVSAYQNHRSVIIGPSNSGKTYYMLKKNIGTKRPIHILTRSTNQHSNYKTSIEKNKR